MSDRGSEQTGVWQGECEVTRKKRANQRTARKSAKKARASKTASPDPVAFLAYSSRDAAQAALLEAAVVAANKDSSVGVTTVSWRTGHHRSSRIIDNILDQISQSDYFLADLTGINENVMFELGYAFGKRRRIIGLIQGHSVSRRKEDLRDLGMISGWNIAPVQNQGEFLNALREFGPSGKQRLPEIDLYGVQTNSPPSTALLLNGLTSHDVASACMAALLNAFPNAYVDDWREDRAQPLTWYLKATVQSKLVVGLFIDPSWDEARAVNGRFAFVCGMAVALGRTVRIVALPGYFPAFDYRDIVRDAPAVSAATRIIEEACQEAQSKSRATERELVAVPEELVSVDRPQCDGKSVILLDMVIGEIGNTMAEHEESELAEYFVPTAQYYEALKGSHSVFVGSKGSGKTANFYRLSAKARDDRRNVVCDVKPEDYKMGRFLQALSHVTTTYGAQPHVAQTAWKVLLLCSLVTTIKSRVDRFASTGSISEVDKRLISFFERHIGLITAPFEQKLDWLAGWLEESNFEPVHFTERAHNAFVSEALNTLHPHVARLTQVLFLVDNLDRAWDRGQDLRLQVQMISALMGLDRELTGDFGGLPVQLTLFLRRNIFEYVLRESRERDKLLAETAELVWNDAELLGRIIQERVRTACDRQSLNGITAWGDVFPSNMDGAPTPRWLYDRIVPRPRDLIHLVRKAIEIAVNRSHNEVRKEDLADAVASYSGFAVIQLIEEYRTEEPWVASIIPAFAGGSPDLSLGDAQDVLARMDLTNCPSPQQVLTRLVEMGFFGIVFGNGSPRYSRTAEDGLLLAGHLATRLTASDLRLVVFPAFRPYLSMAMA